MYYFLKVTQVEIVKLIVNHKVKFKESSIYYICKIVC